MERNPFPELHRIDDLSTGVDPDSDDRLEATSNAKLIMTIRTPHKSKHSVSQRTDVDLYEDIKKRTAEEIEEDKAGAISSTQSTKLEGVNGKQKASVDAMTTS